MPLTREIRRQTVETLAKLNAGIDRPVDIELLSRSLPVGESALLEGLNELSQFGVVIIEGSDCFLTEEGLELLDEIRPEE